MVRRLSLRCVRTCRVASRRRTFSSSVPKKDSICPEMWTVRRIQLGEVPAMREVVRPAIAFTDSFANEFKAFCCEANTTLAQANCGVKLRSCERKARHGIVVTVVQQVKVTVTSAERWRSPETNFQLRTAAATESM